MKNAIKRIALLLVVCFCLSAGAAMAELSFFNGYVETLGKVNVRTGPGLDYESIGRKDKGTHLTFLENTEVDDRGVVWYEVQYSKRETGWVSSKYCELHDYDLYVTAVDGQTNIRKTPSLEGRRLDILHEGESGVFLNQVSIDDRGVAWYKLNFEGVTGWVSSKWTVLGDGSFEDLYVVATDGKTNIRRSPSLDGEQLDTLPLDAEALYLGQTMEDDRGVEWYKIFYEGISGWVSSRYTTLD